MLKKVVCINDLSGFGKCSLTASIPILSALKAQCCPLPTAILSNQTGYPEYTFLDLTKEMMNYYKTWKSLNLDFDCIYSSFLVSKSQVDIVKEILNDNQDKFIVVDPIMGDNGILFSVFNDETRNALKELVSLSTLTTPNITEACFLTGRDYNDLSFSDDELLEVAKDVCRLGPEKVIITGIVIEDKIINICYDKISEEFFMSKSNYNGISYSGTGDIFTSIICGMIMSNKSLKESVLFASSYIEKCVNYTSQFDLNRNDGVLFEQFLSDLTNI